MADKEIELKISTTTEVSNLNDLSGLIDENIEKAHGLEEALNQALTEAEDEVDRLTQLLADVEMGNVEGDFEEIQEELRTATDNAELLQQALDNIDGGGLDSAKESASELNEQLGETGDKAGEVADSLGLIEGVMLADLGNQIGTVSGNAESMAQGMNQASITVGQLATNTGIAEPKMRDLIAYISNATFPQEEAMDYVEALHQLGITADKFGESATNMDRINDAFHIGSNNVISLTRGLSQVGVTADNLPASFNALAYAQSNVNGGVETLTLGLRRQGATFNELGLNVDQVAVVMAGASKKWTDSRKLNSGLSEALKNCNGDLRALEQELGLEAGALDNASQYTSQYKDKIYELANQEKEHKTITEQATAIWDDLSLKFSGILTPMADVLGVMAGFGQMMVYANATKELAISFGLLKTTEEGSIAINYAFGISGNFAIGWIILAIALGVLLGLAFIYLYENCDWFREAVDNLGASLQWLASEVINQVTSAINWLSSLFNDFTNQIGLDTNDWIQAVLGFILFIPTLPMQLAIALTNAIARALGFKGDFVQSMIKAGSDAVNGFISYITQIPGIVMGEFNRTLGMVNDFINTLPDRVWDMGKAIIDALKSSLGIHSPGYMYYIFQGELERIEGLPEDKSFDITRNVRTLGNNIIDSFQPTDLTLDLNANIGNITSTNDLIPKLNHDLTGVNGDTIINVYGDVDNDERMKKIVDAVRKELSWNNATAGRTV